MSWDGALGARIASGAPVRPVTALRMASSTCGEQITVHYLSSQDLGYDGSSHPLRMDRSYMKRVNRLMNAISREAALTDTARSEQTPAPTPPRSWPQLPGSCGS